MGIMCNFMDNGLDEELVKDSPDPIKNKKIYTRIGGSIAGEATKLVKTVKSAAQSYWRSQCTLSGIRTDAGSIVT